METLDEIEARAREYAVIERIAALEEKVAALGNDAAKIREDMHHRKDVEEIRLEHDVRDLRADNARLTSDLKQTGDYLMLLTKECVELREERATMQKSLEDALLMGRDALFAAQAREQKLAEENAELRKRVAALTDTCNSLGREEHREGQPPTPQWPAPQPIETAPLGEILAGPAPNGFAWAPERPLAGCSLESWRAQLREAERRWWMPMPPPGGGE